MRQFHGSGLRLLAEVEGNILTLRPLFRQPGADAVRSIEFIRSDETGREFAITPEDKAALENLLGIWAGDPTIAIAGSLKGYKPIYEPWSGPKVISQQMQDLLSRLGEAMSGYVPVVPDNANNVPAAFTYIGQFIAHDISDMTAKGDNLSTPALDLSSVFGAPPIEDPDDLIGETTTGRRLDLKRDADGNIIGPDSRNDNNLAVAQVQVMVARLFEKAHAVLSPADARRWTINMFQIAVLRDYLTAITGFDAEKQGFKTTDHVIVPAQAGNTFLMPLEVALAFFRFGHVMVRPHYEKWGSLGAPGSSTLLREHTGFGAEISRMSPHLKDSWAMDWSTMLTGGNKALSIWCGVVTAMTDVPANLSKDPLDPTGGSDSTIKVPTETVLRGAQLGLPSAQDFISWLSAKRPGFAFTSYDPADDAVLDPVLSNASSAMRGFMAGDGIGFRDATPLWLYTLIEARAAAGGQHLGPLAGRIVLETIRAAIFADNDGVLSGGAGFDPTIGLLWDGRPITFEALVECAFST